MVESSEGVLEITDLRNWTRVVENFVNQADKQDGAQKKVVHIVLCKEKVLYK